MSAGFCWWHQGAADDVEMLAVIERGSGPSAGVYVCQPCAKEAATGRGGYGPAARGALKALEQRADTDTRPEGTSYLSSVVRERLLGGDTHA